jgi:hypothetical protein
MATHVGSGGNCGTDNAWYCETVDDTSNDVGVYTSIAIDPTTNLPVIAYGAMSPSSLKLATTWSGGWDIRTIDDDWVRFASLKIDSTGAAHIAYHRSDGTDCMYTDCFIYAKRVSAGDGNCGEFNFQCDIIEKGNEVGQYPSLALNSSGQPRIAYQDGDTGGLWFAQPSSSGNCGPGNTWGCYPISTSPGAGRYASLDISNNDIPHIAHYDTGKLAYAVWVGSEGNCGVLDAWQCDELATMGTTTHTRDVALAVDKAGAPIIAYHSYVVGDPFTVKSFQVIRPAAARGLQSGNCGPDNLWWCERIPDSGHIGDYSAIAVGPSGLATIAYIKSEYISTLRVAYQKYHQIFLPLVTKK